MIVTTKFLWQMPMKRAEKLKEAYNTYYSILGEYPNSSVIKRRLDSFTNEEYQERGSSCAKNGLRFWPCGQLSINNICNGIWIICF